MVMYNLENYSNETILEALGFASDSGEPMANSHSKQVSDEELVQTLFSAYGEPYTDEEKHRVAEYRARAHSINECECESCLAELNDFGNEDYDDESPEEYLAEELDEATMEVIENFVFLGDGTTTKDVMIAILSLESTIAQIKLHLLESE